MAKMEALLQLSESELRLFSAGSVRRLIVPRAYVSRAVACTLLSDVCSAVSIPANLLDCTWLGNLR